MTSTVDESTVDESLNEDDDDGSNDSGAEEEVMMANLQLPVAFGRRGTGQQSGAKGAKVSKQRAQRTALPGVQPGGANSQATAVDHHFNDETTASGIPVSLQVKIPAHGKRLWALASNPKGSRVVSGGHDYKVKMWDFNGMTSSMRPFREIEPAEGHSIQSLSFSCSGSHFACSCGEAVLRIYNAEGTKIQETVKGDMYVRDANNTKGHTHMIFDTSWHPFDREKFMTASQDATIRLWNLTEKAYGIDQALPHVQVLKAIDKRKLNASSCHVLCSTWSPTKGQCIVGGCNDGSLQLWHEKRKYGKPDLVVREAHSGGNASTAVKFFRDDQRLLSRGLDSTLKLWDVRKFKDPIATFNDLPTIDDKSNIALSPCESWILCGKQMKESGGIEIIESSALKRCGSIKLDVGAVRIEWPDEINQLLVGCMDGGLRMLYDPERSQRGALCFVDKEAIKTGAQVPGYMDPVFTLDALPEGFKETREGGLRQLRKRPNRDATKSIIPARPTGVEGSDGQPATSRNMSQFIMSKLVGEADKEQKDSVEVLRSYAEKAERDPLFITTAYRETQPKPVLDYSMQVGDDESMLSDVRKCPRCGLKMCTCGYMKIEEAIKGPSIKQRRTA